MEDKQTYIRRETDRLLQEWSARTAVLGAGIFLCLSLLDFYSASDHAVRFLGYRVVVAAFLAATAVATRRTQRRAVMHLLCFLGVLASAIALEAMILGFGGHHSPYLIGLILLAVVVAGLIPTGAGFAALSLGSIFVVYLVPILLWDTVSEPTFFTVNTVLFFCVLASGVLVRWFHQKHLVGQISLRHDLIRSRENLEIEVAQRKQADTERTSNEERLSLFAAAVEGAAEGIFILDPEGQIVYCNTAAAEQSGHTPARVIGLNIRQMYRDHALVEAVYPPGPAVRRALVRRDSRVRPHRQADPALAHRVAGAQPRGPGHRDDRPDPGPRRPEKNRGGATCAPRRSSPWVCSPAASRTISTTC